MCSHTRMERQVRLLLKNESGDSSDLIRFDNKSSDSADSKEDGVITISIQDIFILLAISSAATITFLWRARRNQSKNEQEKEA